MTIEECAARIGEPVVRRAAALPAAEGVLTHVDGFAYVRYGGEYVSTATAPELLELLAGAR
jgi:hypothetical protein